MDKNEVFSDVDEILEVSHGFGQRIEFAQASWTTESDALKLFESQLDILETIRDLVSRDRYVEAFILNRSVFENYFLISLMLKGTKYKLKYKVRAGPDETPKQAYSKLVANLEKQIAEGRRDIVSFRPLRKHKQIEIIHKGLFSEKGDRVIPVYYFVFEEYDATRHRIDRISSVASKQLFSEHLGEWQKKHEALYKAYLGFRNIIEAAVLNDLITEEQKIRVQVHYNFLSGFTHLTRMGFDLTKSYNWPKNTRYLRELNLLYILRILRLYLLLLMDFFATTEHKIKDVKKLTSYISKMGSKYDYFWFIFNKPSEYDFWKYQTAKGYHRKKGRLLDEKIPYYRDPYERLRGQHRTQAHELTTGLVYESPWPKKDAFP